MTTQQAVDFCRLANEAVLDIYFHATECPLGGATIDLLGDSCLLSPEDAAARGGALDDSRLVPPAQRPGNTEAPGPVLLDLNRPTRAVLRGKPRDSTEPWTTWEFYGPDSPVASRPAEARALVAWFEERCPGYEFTVVETALRVVEVRRLA